MGALVVFDVTKRVTFTNAAQWIKELKAHADPDIVIMLVGNKLDLCEHDAGLRKVSREEAEAFAKKQRLLYEETSAVENLNVDSAFLRLLKGVPNC